MGEDIMSTEGATLSGAFFRKWKPYMDTALESPLNGRRRCTDKKSLSLRPKDRVITISEGESSVSFLHQSINFKNTLAFLFT